MEGFVQRGHSALGITSAPTAVLLLSDTVFSPQKGSHLCLQVHKHWVWVWAQLPTFLLSPSHPWVLRLCVRITSTAKCWGFQLAALVCGGEGKARGHTRTGFPCGCRIWLLRSAMCFPLLFWFILSKVSEVGLPGLAVLEDGMLCSALVSHTGIDTFGVSPSPESLQQSKFLGLYPITFPFMYVLWAKCSTQLAVLHWSKVSGAFSELLRFSNLYSQTVCL